MEAIREYRYISGAAEHIASFVAIKRAAGYPYNGSALILRKFDRMLAEDFPGLTMITKEACDEWINRSRVLHPNTLIRRVTPVRQLCKYLAATGVKAYIIPRNIPAKSVKYQPHVFSYGEISAFFAAVDKGERSPYAPFDHIVAPCLLRLIYCCGLRNSESRNLALSDVDLQTGKVVIRESKGWKRRIVYLSDDMLEQCRLYDQEIRKVCPARTMFFPSVRGGIMGKDGPGRLFHKYWDGLPQANNVTGNKPRVHDFRHSYAVHILNRWFKEGANLSAMYPYLSEYLGHAHYQDTDYYMHLVDDFYPELERRMNAVNENILPGIPKSKMR